MYGFEHGWGWLLPLLLIAIVYYLFQNRKTQRSSAQDILDKRYASGGISKEEYDEKSKHLKENA